VSASDIRVDSGEITLPPASFAVVNTLALDPDLTV